jgi:S-DNA-T family DNA segregation ATPase FtsK/SpoIIIE
VLLDKVLDAEPVEDTNETGTHHGQATAAEEPNVRPNVHVDGDLPPVLPDWVKSWTQVKNRTRTKAKRYRHHTAAHAVRLPLYSARTLRLSVRGCGRSLRGLGIWLLAHEYAEVIGSGKDAKEKLNHRKERSKARKTRAVVAAVGVLGLTVFMLVAPLTWSAVFVLAVLGVLAAVGRREDDRIIDPTMLPPREDLRAEHLNAAFRAAGLLGNKSAEDGPKLQLLSDPLLDGPGWAVVFDLPKGTGKTAADALARQDIIAKELGVDEIQVVMRRIRAAEGGHAGRLSLWVALDDPYLTDPVPSPLEKMDQFSMWDPIPFGQDARLTRVNILLMWQSIFFGGLQGRGKTFSQRLVVAAGVLDPQVRLYVADFGGGPDWKATEKVAHKLILGAEDDALADFDKMLEEIIADMERRYAKLRGLPEHECPQGKLTPQISLKYGLPITFLVIDELQEALDTLEPDLRKQVITRLCRIIRRGRKLGILVCLASQRPDANSVPTRLRDIVTFRSCTQVKNRDTSDMVLGDGMARMGADASKLSEEHLGVNVLVTGPASFVTVRADYMDLPTFSAVCARGRKLREEAGTLTGHAAGDAMVQAQDLGYVPPPVVSDVLDVMRHSARMYTVDILAGLVKLDEDTYGDWDGERLAAELTAAGVVRKFTQVKINGKNLAGWYRSDIEGVLPADYGL